MKRFHKRAHLFVLMNSSHPEHCQCDSSGSADPKCVQNRRVSWFKQLNAFAELHFSFSPSFSRVQGSVLTYIFDCTVSHTVSSLWLLLSPEITTLTQSSVDPSFILIASSLIVSLDSLQVHVLVFISGKTPQKSSDLADMTTTCQTQVFWVTPPSAYRIHIPQKKSLHFDGNVAHSSPSPSPCVISNCVTSVSKFSSAANSAVRPSPWTHHRRLSRSHRTVRPQSPPDYDAADKRGSQKPTVQMIKL